jgi:hypothetical protein
LRNEVGTQLSLAGEKCVPGESIRGQDIYLGSPSAFLSEQPRIESCHVLNQPPVIRLGRHARPDYLLNAGHDLSLKSGISSYHHGY